MADVVELRSERRLRIEHAAREVIAAFGAEAGYRMGLFARNPAFGPETRADLLEV